MKIINTYTTNALLLLLAFFGSIELVSGQQQQQFTQYMYNPLSLNSGYVTDQKLEAGIIHRSQWVGIDGAPSTQSLTIAGRTGRRVGLGLTLMNESIGPANNLDFNGVFSYNIPLSYSMSLSFGMNFGVDILNIDWSKGSSADQEDPGLINGTNVTPIIGAGAYLHGDRWYIGLSTPNFIKTEAYNDEQELVIDKTTQFYLMGGYVFDITPDFKLRPSTLMKYNDGSPVTVDVSLNVLLQERFTAGLSYRFNDAVSALLGFHISRSFFVGYAYDYSTTELNKYNDGSHEIMLKYTVPMFNTRAKSPRFF